MATKLPAGTRKLLFVFLFLGILWACNNERPVDKNVSKAVNVHIRVTDVTGKRIWDTTFKSDPSLPDYRHMMRTLSYPCDSTGGSSRCGNIFEVWTEEIKDIDTSVKDDDKK